VVLASKVIVDFDQLFMKRISSLELSSVEIILFGRLKAMATASIRARIDRELTSRVGKWFTVRQIQDKLKINPSTLKPLIMKYARERVLVRRKVKGTARSVEFSPAASSITNFHKALVRFMPYREATVAYKTATKRSKTAKTTKKTTARKATSRRRR